MSLWYRKPEIGLSKDLTAVADFEWFYPSKRLERLERNHEILKRRLSV